jgi:hypothetical protein
VYRVWRYDVTDLSSTINVGWHIGEAIPTNITFKARTKREAMKKARHQFYIDGKLGMERIFVKLDTKEQV